MMSEDRLDDATEDFDERCDGTEACDCDDCTEPECECIDVCTCGDDDPDYCRCGVYLDGDFHGRHEKYPALCEECGDEIEDADDGPYALPDEFPNDDEECDFTEEDVIT
jgi:hypothetical protein